MPVMTPDDLHRFLEEEFPQAPPGFSVESVDDTTIRVRQKTGTAICGQAARSRVRP